MTAVTLKKVEVLPKIESNSPENALHLALEAIGDRWSLAVVARLTEGPKRFNDLARELQPIARTVLSDRLKKLEQRDIIIRKAYSESPIRYNYKLSVAGAELAKVSGLLANWGSQHLGDGTPALTHEKCGDTVMPAWHCVSCGPVVPREVV